MALARADPIARLLAFWLVGYGERLWRLVGRFVVEFVGVWVLSWFGLREKSGTIAPP